MSQIKPSLAVMAVSLLCTFMLAGCGERNSQAVFGPENGKHVANWLPAGHAAAAKTDLESCTECHGEDLAGGIVKVSCTQCHLGSQGEVHPLQWGQYAYARHKGFVRVNGTFSCSNAVCHGPTLTGVAGSGPSCETACHLGGANFKHPAVWDTYTASARFSGHATYARSNGITSCSIAACHGTDARGVFLSGPSCYLCHSIAANAKHPPALVNSSGHFVHNQYLFDNPTFTATCLTSICHGPGGTGPSCSTTGCHI